MSVSVCLCGACGGFGGWGGRGRFIVIFIAETKFQCDFELVKAELGFVQRKLECQSLLHYPVNMNGYTRQACPILNTSVQ